MAARNGCGPAVRRNASNIAITNPSANAPSDKRIVSHAPFSNCGRWSQTMPNWKTYFMTRPPPRCGSARARWSHRGQVDQRDFGVLLVDVRQHAVVLVQKYPRSQELEQIEITRPHGRRVIGGADGELVLDLRLGIAVADRFCGDCGHAGGVHL